MIEQQIHISFKKLTRKVQACEHLYAQNFLTDATRASVFAAIVYCSCQHVAK